MAKPKVQMPQSTAGLIHYFEDSKAAIKFKPQHVVVVAIVIIAFELALRFGLFGF
jgi:preprotein translocase subunit Sec61beta